MQHWHTRHCANAPAGPAAAGSGATAGAARAGWAPGRDLSAHAPATRARRGNRPPLQAAWALQQQQAIGPGAPREAPYLHASKCEEEDEHEASLEQGVVAIT